MMMTNSRMMVTRQPIRMGVSSGEELADGLVTGRKVGLLNVCTACL